MSVKLVTNEKIALTSSKGNQEKWCDNNVWYKLDQFGYEALAEAVTSKILEKSNVETQTPFASPFSMTFNRELKTIHSLYGSVLKLPKFTNAEIYELIKPYLEFYPKRDRSIIKNRVEQCIFERQKLI